MSDIGIFEFKLSQFGKFKWYHLPSQSEGEISDGYKKSERHNAFESCTSDDKYKNKEFCSASYSIYRFFQKIYLYPGSTLWREEPDSCIYRSLPPAERQGCGLYTDRKGKKLQSLD
jgi:hypothetical protein